MPKPLNETEQIVNAFKRRMEAMTQHHQQKLSSTIQQSIEHDFEALYGPPQPSNKVTFIRRSSRRFVGHVGKWVRKPFTRGQQQPTPLQDDLIIDVEFTVLDPEKPTRQTETKDEEKKL